MIINDTESVVGDPLDVLETDNTCDLGEGTQREFIFGGILWDACWIDQWDLYDDLEDWDDEPSRANPGEDMDYDESNDIG